ncbi:helix-turn-helix domain-containing protein [Nostoc sp.]|uniref:helix-turn-helix domain-containing protein n=1 Tax=Nostoc sp. TaxID=1180 RepID=UPI002FFC0575
MLVIHFTIGTEWQAKQNGKTWFKFRLCSHRIPEEEMLLELLVTLIEKFEETHYPIPQSTPHSMLMHLMEAGDITPEALVNVIGSREVILEIVNGDRSINKAQAEALADYFRLDASLFFF